MIQSVLNYFHSWIQPQYKLQTEFHQSQSTNLPELERKVQGPIVFSHDETPDDIIKKAEEIQELWRQGPPLHIEVQAHTVGDSKNSVYFVRATKDECPWVHAITRFDRCIRALDTSTFNKGVPQCLQQAGFSGISPWFEAQKF